MPVRPGSPQWLGGSVPATSTFPPQMCSGGTRRAPRSGVPHEGHPEHRVGSAQGLGPGGHHPQWGSRCCTPEMGLLGQGPRPRSRPSKQGLLIHTMALLSFQTISFNSAFNAKSVFFLSPLPKAKEKELGGRGAQLGVPLQGQTSRVVPGPSSASVPTEASPRAGSCLDIYWGKRSYFAFRSLFRTA